MNKPLLIIQPATSHDDMPALCAVRGDEIAWFGNACGVGRDGMLAVKVYEDEPLPDPSRICGAIIAGAIDMVTDPKPWIQNLTAWLRLAVAQDVPLLGVCFGHQMLAHALGGEVGDNPRGPMFGAVSVACTDAAWTDPLFEVLPEETTMHAFHYQSVLRLPEGAQVLATTPHDPHYGVRFSPAAWGVQFHPEFDRKIMEGCIDTYAGAMAAAGFSPEDLRARNRDCADGARFLRRFTAIADPE
jgi:GMP synthase (glutamine-hydrolysing)